METSSLNILAATKRKIARDKLLKFKGAAQISFQHLEFPHPTRQIDRKVIQQLLREFDGEGCIKEERSHRIPAIIDNSILEAVLEAIPLTADGFRAKADHPPILKLGAGVKLECLHGQHRVLAAKEHLAASKWWWIVDIYGADLNKDTKQALQEGYSYSAKYKSGEIFRHMRLCHYDKDSLGVQRWRARFSPSQDKFLEQLFKRPILLDALDSVLHIQGVWREFYVGSLDVFLFPKCDEEIAHYIKFIKEVLTRILDGDTATMMRTDPITIASIQSRSPALSKSDYDFIQQMSGELFPEVIDPAKRANIIQRLLTTEELIPSLYTLIKDIRYLKQSATLLAKLLPDSRKKTLRQRWFHHFANELSDERIEIQRGVLGPFTTVPSNHIDAFNACYQQLWLCSYRVCKHANAYGQLQLAELAYRLGFSTPKIKLEVTRDPAQTVIENTLRDVFHTLRPNEKFIFDASKASPIIASFKGYLSSLEITPTDTILPSITVGGTGIPLSCRSGHGQMDTWDLAHLFLDRMNAPLSQYRRDGDEISSFYVKRSRHIAFFGGIDLAGTQQGPPTDRVSAGSSSDHQQIDTSRPAVECTRSTSSSNDQSRAPNRGTGGNQVVVYNDQVHSPDQEIESNQVVLYKEGEVRFIEDGIVLQEIPFREEDVNRQAKEYADQGKKLFLDEGPYFTWQDCFEILTRTGRSVVTVTTVVEPWIGKRRRGKLLPERLQPATKEAFDFDMNGENELESF